MRAKRSRLLIGFAALIVTAGAVWLSLDWIGGLAFRRGLQAQRDWKLAQAVNYLTWAQRLQRAKTPATLELGVCEQLRGDFLASQKHLDGLLQTRIDDAAILSRIHNTIGINQYSFNQPDAALAAHQKALEHAKMAGDRRLEGEALIGMSRVFYHSKGKFDDAVASLELALSIGKAIPDERLQASSLRNLGVVYWWFKGELDRPLNEFYFPALELYRRQNDQRGAATMLTLIALVFNNKGDIYNFMRYQTESLEIQERIGDQAGLSDSYMTLGILYNGLGNYRKARDFFSRGLNITRRTGYALAQSDLNALLADVHVNLEEYDEALKLYDPDSKHKDPNSALSNYVLQYIGHCYQLKGDYRQALTLYERALQVHRQSGHPDVRFRANTLLRNAECAIALGDWPQAARYWALARPVFESGETHSEGAIRTALVAGALARHEGRHEQALRYLREALDVEEQIFASAKTNLLIPPHRRSYEMLYGFLLDYAIANNDSQLTRIANELLFGFLENMRYRSLRNFLVQVKERRIPSSPPNENERALNERIKKLSQDLRARGNEATREQLRKAYHDFEEITLKAQLQQPQYLAISAAKPVGLADLQQTLPASTALIEFLFVGERVCAVVINQKSVRTVELPIKKRTLTAKAKLFRSLVFNDATSEDAWLPVATSLRTNLIEPLEASGALSNINTLALVPYGLLHDLPFAALARSDNGDVKFLIEEFAVFQTPSATFVTSKSKDVRSDLKPGATLAFGRNRSSDMNLPNLAFAAEEASAVAQIAGGRAFVNELATETELKRLALDSGFLHLSTHGVAESEMPLFSRLLLEPTSTDDGSLTVREIFELGLRTDLVTLSACETGQSFSASGGDQVEQDRIGLIEAFLHAGSRGVLATLLPVSDRPTTAFMKYFYGQLASNKSTTEALAATQRAMLRGEIALPETTSAGAALTHPRYWAPFILAGNPR
jgi:CHAT domain-containing protein